VAAGEFGSQFLHEFEPLLEVRCLVRRQVAADVFGALHH
jgi:hypothetical protein